MKIIEVPATKKEYWKAFKSFIFWRPLNKIRIFYLSRFDKEYMAMDKERRSWLSSGNAAVRKVVDENLAKMIREQP